MDDHNLRIKNQYLQQEIDSLQFELKEMRDLTSMQKQIIDQLIKENTSQLEQKGSMKVIQTLMEENEKLRSMVNLITQQRDESRSYSLINEQISENCQRREVESQAELQAQVLELEERVQQQENIIQQYERKIEDEIKLRIDNPRTCYVYQTTSDTLHMLEEIQYLRVQVEKYKKLSEQLNMEKKNVTNINNVQYQIYGKVLSLKISRMQRFQSAKNKDIVSMAVSYDMDDSDMDMDDGLPVKVKNPHQNANRPIPKLDIQAAQQLQNKSLDKQDEMMIQHKTQELDTLSLLNPLKKVFGSKYQSTLNELVEMIRTIQQELRSCKFNLQDEMLLSKSLEVELDQTKRLLEGSEQINRLLIDSQKRYEAKWSQINSLFYQYYNYFVSHMDSNIDLNLDGKKIHPYFLSPRALKIGKEELNLSLLQMNFGQMTEVTEQSDHLTQECVTEQNEKDADEKIEFK